MMDERPLVGITIGDPAGIGPEIVARAIAVPDLHRLARLLVFGTPSIMQKAFELVGAALSVHLVQSPSEGEYKSGVMDLIDPAKLSFESLRPGVVQAEAGRAAYEYFAEAIRLAMASEIDCIATAPLNKEALKAGGVQHIDHTATLAGLTNSPNPMTLFVQDNLRIFFLTRHVALAQAIRQVTEENVLAALRRVDRELRRLGMRRARIAVAGLNPHAGEGGLFGNEDATEIAPAVARARAEGIDAYGPIPPDSVFFQNVQGKYDAVLSLYHDQGHIAAKTRDFERTVAVTLGIPFIRTSVDHGTAFDIAWKGVASPISMVEAIRVAADYARLLRGPATG